MLNPIMQMLMQGMRGGGDPMPLLQQMAGQNPQLGGALGMIQGKSPAQLEQIARNMYKERGIDIAQAARQLGFKI